MTKLYYTPPTQEVFEEVKEAAAAIALWSTMGDEPSYAEEKIGRIRNLENISDNFMYLVAMFDVFNQKILADNLSDEAREALRLRMKDCGTPDFLNVF